MTNLSFKSLVIFTVGIVAGFFLYLQFGSDSEKISSGQDSLLVDNLHASSSTGEIADALYKSRQNSITNAVNELSPAVVGINIIREIHFQFSKIYLAPQDAHLLSDMQEYWKNKQVSEIG